MAKSKSRKRPRVEATSVATPTVVDEDERIEGLNLYPDELDTTVATLTLLAENPTALKSKAFKALRTAIYDIHRVHSASLTTGASLTSRISAALVDGRHVDALVLLSELKIRKQKPKLGSLQRWVRECDAASIGMGQGEVIWEVLEAILRTTLDDAAPTSYLNSSMKTSNPGIVHHEPWLAGCLNTSHVWDKVASQTLFSEEEGKNIRTIFTPLQTIPGPQRRPPNLFPSIIYFGAPGSITLSPDNLPVKRNEVPQVPKAFMLNNVLLPEECTSIIKMAEALGLVADQPVAGSAANMTSVLAHNLIWLADATFIGTFYSRLVSFLPQTISGGGVRGINTRFRIYRYRPGSVYRPHIDGAWPSSALFTDASTTPPRYSYVYDSDPALYSRLTLLIYLNDEFSGGCTTFFTPREQGGLDAWPVRPVMGSALVFPHGATEGSLLHEGSPVTEGAKYVIRTEVLYEVDRGERGGLEVEL